MRDVLNAPRVAIINETAVRTFFSNDSPLGRRFGSNPETSAEVEAVGVVRDVKYNSVRDEAPPTMYVPDKQSPVGSMAFEIRTAGDPAQAIAAIREAVRQVDPTVPLMNASTQMEQIELRFSHAIAALTCVFSEMRANFRQLLFDFLALFYVQSEHIFEPPDPSGISFDYADDGIEVALQVGEGRLTAGGATARTH